MQKVLSFDTDYIFTVGLVVCRVGLIFTLMPGFSHGAIPKKIKVAFLVIFSLAVSQGVIPGTLPMPKDGSVLATMLLTELVIGLFIGLCVKILFLSLEIAGNIISQQMGLQNASIFDPSIAQQNSYVGQFAMLGACALVFITDLHQLIIGGLVNSYNTFPLNAPIMWEDMHYGILRCVADSFSMALKLAGPSIIVTIFFYCSSGLINRLMPQMMVFFVVQPLQVLLGFVVLLVSITSLVMVCFDKISLFLQGL